MVHLCSQSHPQTTISTRLRTIYRHLELEDTNSESDHGGHKRGGVDNRAGGGGVGGSRGRSAAGAGAGAGARAGRARRGRGAGGGVGQRGGRGAVQHLDAGVVTGLVAVLVVLGGVVVDNLDGLNVHDERNVVKVSLTTSPLNGTLGVGGVTTGPDTDLQQGGGLGEVLSAVGILVLQGADDIAINEPLNALLSPVDTVGVELGLGVGDVDSGGAVPAGGVTLAEVVSLNLLVVGADLLLFGFT